MQTKLKNVITLSILLSTISITILVIKSNDLNKVKETQPTINSFEQLKVELDSSQSIEGWILKDAGQSTIILEKNRHVIAFQLLSSDFSEEALINENMYVDLHHFSVFGENAYIMDLASIESERKTVYQNTVTVKYLEKRTNSDGENISILNSTIEMKDGKLKIDITVPSNPENVDYQTIEEIYKIIGDLQ